MMIGIIKLTSSKGPVWQWWCSRPASGRSPRTREARICPHRAHGSLWRRYTNYSSLIHLYHDRITNLISSAVFGPVATKWFGILQRHVNLNSTLTTTLARVGCDQFLFAPVQLTAFLSSMAIMEGSSPSEKWHHSFWPAYKANCMVWPIVQSANFAFVPLELRVLVVNVVSLGELSVTRISLKQFIYWLGDRLELFPKSDEQRRRVMAWCHLWFLRFALYSLTLDGLYMIPIIDLVLYSSHCCPQHLPTPSELLQ